MPIKISKVIKDLNVGSTTIQDFLRKKGIEIDTSNVNVRIADDVYDILVKEFRPDMDQKIKSEKQTKERQQKKKEEAPKVEEIRTIIPGQKPKILGKIDLDKAGKPQPRVEEKPAPEVTAKPEVKPEPKPEPKPTPAIKSIDENIFYSIRSSKINPSEYGKIERVANFLKENPKANVTITGYADVQTGNPKINMKYSQERAEALKKYITSKYGIDPSRIQTDAKGDTVQPFDEAVKNRVSIVSGKYSVME